VDAKHAAQTLNDRQEARRQIGFADQIFISKSELVAKDELDALQHRLKHMNPRAPQHIVHFGEIGIDKVFDLRAGQIIQRIRSFIRSSESNRVLTLIAPMVSEVVELAELEMRRRQVRLSLYVSDRISKILVDPILIEQVLINLLKNAAEAIGHAKRPIDDRHVELQIVPKIIEGQQVVAFSVTDNGNGMTDEVMHRVFEAFYTTKKEGMGIGLNLCRSIVESHQGRMQAENIYNGNTIVGCRFSFWLPANPVMVNI